MIWILVLAITLVGIGLVLAMLTGGDRYDSGTLWQFIAGVVATILGVGCFGVWAIIRLL